MEIFLVGGALRDQLLNIPISERDWVVVGATAQELLDQGFRPVGKDFPVFLHPETKEEYALARTERKTARGYSGFCVYSAPDVTLEQDLARRDLTINAMAQGVDGRLIDPFHGQQDLAKRLLRHVSPAFVEDPVRILRVARFAARFAHYHFHVAHSTHQLMCLMVENGEVDALVPERVWKETHKALGQPDPARFFGVLSACGALEKIFPEWMSLFPGTPPCLKSKTPLSCAVANKAPEIVRFACLWGDCGASVSVMHQACERLKVPTEYRELAELTIRYSAAAANAKVMDYLDWLEKLDAFRRTARFQLWLDTSRCLYPNGPWQALAHSYTQAASLTAQPFLAQGLQGKAIGQALYKARQQLICGQQAAATCTLPR